MPDSLVNLCLYDYRVHCDYYNDRVKTNFKETYPNNLCQCDSCIKDIPKCHSSQTLKIIGLIKPVVTTINPSKHLWL